MGFFGFFGGLTNWIAVELFFVKIPLIYGRCVSCIYVCLSVCQFVSVSVCVVDKPYKNYS